MKKLIIISIFLFAYIHVIQQSKACEPAPTPTPSPTETPLNELVSTNFDLLREDILNKTTSTNAKEKLAKYLNKILKDKNYFVKDSFT